MTAIEYEDAVKHPEINSLWKQLVHLNRFDIIAARRVYKLPPLELRSNQSFGSG